MNATDLQDALVNLIETLADARDEVEGEDDDITLADYLRDIQSDLDECATALTFRHAGVLTGNEGLVVRTSGGDEFQITIVQSRHGAGARDEDEGDDE